ncbi:MAG: zinc metallopeptidase [Nitrospira sp.]|nr:zinc metallopeptidase [Nitrospira sp.]TKB73828.1 MAG: zinc metallopeptidase [Nitrospira sp.]
MRLVLLLIIVAVVVFGPQLWTRRVFAKHSTPRPDYPGTGAELARHLLDQLDLTHIKVEATELGDHYDPEAKAVRLTPDKFNGKSLTAITVAAHEVGHAIQDRAGYQPFTERTRLVRVAQGAQKLGGIVMMGIPIAAALAQTPVAAVVVLVAGIATMGIATLVHLVTLPVEWDASFRRALPILQQKNYLSPEDEQGARRILTAAALTYVAASLASLLNLWRWLAFLRR